MDVRAKGRPNATVLGFAFAALLAGLLIADPVARPSGLLRDFNAFYCAGAALDRGADPYRAEPLGSCERVAQPEPLAAGRANLAVPAPLPPYALLPFALLARLPYPLAAALWTVLLIGAVVAAAWAMRRASGLPWPALVAAFALGDGYAAVCLGQIAPLAVAALAVATMFAEQHRYAEAGAAAAVAMLEPHVGLPACVALFMWHGRSRLPLLCGAALCVAVSLWLVGRPVLFEYAESVVPAHALSEIANEKQLSLSYLLHRFGVEAATAVRIGSLSYLAMLALGCAVAGPLANRLRSQGLIVALPAAFGLIGGPFSHIAQVPAALPAVLLLDARVPAMRRSLVPIAIALAIPWVQFTSLGTVFAILAGAAGATLARTLGGMRVLAAGALALGIIVFVGALFALIVTEVPTADAVLAAHYDPHALAEASWTLYVQTVGTSNLAAFDLARLPTVAGLIALGCLCLALATRPGSPARRTAFGPDGNGSAATERMAS